MRDKLWEGSRAKAKTIVILKLKNDTFGKARLQSLVNTQKIHRKIWTNYYIYCIISKYLHRRSFWVEFYHSYNARVKKWILLLLAIFCSCYILFISGFFIFFNKTFSTPFFGFLVEENLTISDTSFFIVTTILKTRSG